MREINFRAWHIKDKVMTMVDELHFPQGGIMVFDGCCYRGWEGKDMVIMQYTGLKDKNGVKIYDGDLCEDESINNGGYLEVVWNDKHCWGCKVHDKSHVLSNGLTFPLWQWDRCKENAFRQLTVIGNIYDNPELIEGGR